MSAVEDDRVRPLIRSVPNVTGILAVGGRTLLGYDQAIAFATGATPLPRHTLPYAERDNVRIVNGPYLDMCGLVASIDWGRERVTVTVKIFDRPTPLELGFDDVEKMT